MGRACVECEGEAGDCRAVLDKLPSRNHRVQSGSLRESNVHLPAPALKLDSWHC